MIKSEQFNDLVEEVKSLVEAKLELEKLKLAEKFSSVSAKLLSSVILGGLFLALFILTSLFLALLISWLFDSTLIGFGSLSLVYLILLWTVYKYRKSWLKKPIQDKIIREIFEEKNED